MVVADRQHPHLHRRQPGGERAGVVLEQHAEEPLDRAEQGPVDHDRRCRSPSAPTYSRPKRSGMLKSTWMVDSCQLRPMASRTFTSILGP